MSNSQFYIYGKCIEKMRFYLLFLRPSPLPLSPPALLKVHHTRNSAGWVYMRRLGGHVCQSDNTMAKQQVMLALLLALIVARVNAEMATLIFAGGCMIASAFSGAYSYRWWSGVTTDNNANHQANQNLKKILDILNRQCPVGISNMVSYAPDVNACLGAQITMLSQKFDRANATEWTEEQEQCFALKPQVANLWEHFARSQRLSNVDLFGKPLVYALFPACLIFMLLRGMCYWAKSQAEKRKHKSTKLIVHSDPSVSKKSGSEKAIAWMCWAAFLCTYFATAFTLMHLANEISTLYANVQKDTPDVLQRVLECLKPARI